MKNIIEEIYNGNNLPFVKFHINTKDYLQKLKEVSKLETDIIEKFPECQELLEHYFDLRTETSNISAFHRFEMGFKAGAQIMLEMLSPIE